MVGSIIRFLPLALASLSLINAQELPGAFGPPPDSDPLTWGFYGTHEVQRPAELDIEGNFPEWLSGSLYRGAAATWDVGNFTAEHWFDGFSRNHRFEIANGRVTYRSRNASDELADIIRESGRVPAGGAFGGDPCKIIFGAFEATYRGSENPVGDKSTENVNVVYIPNFPGLDRNTSTSGSPLKTLVIATETTALQQIDPVDLEPIELFTANAYHASLSNTGPQAAHPALYADGSMYNYQLDLSAEPPTYTIFGIIAETGKVEILATIDDAPPAYIHNVFNTENFIILIVWQADFTRSGKTLMSSLGPWDPERKTLFYVIDRARGGVVAKYVSEDTFFAFHRINSFEEADGAIIIDLPTMENYTFLEAATVPNLRANLGSKINASSHQDLAGVFTRYRLPSQGAAAQRVNGSLISHLAEVVFTLPYSSGNIELPQINNAYAQRPYSYAYGIHTDKPGYFADSLIKVDTRAREVKTWLPSTNVMPSEPVFAAAPGAAREDDGVLLTVIMDAEAKNSALVVVNATTMEEMGRARMPIVMGYGFHGVWGSSAG